MYILLYQPQTYLNLDWLNRLASLAMTHYISIVIAGKTRLAMLSSTFCVHFRWHQLKFLCSLLPFYTYFQ